MRRQSLIQLHLPFIHECVSERIIKIGQHLLKLSQKVSGTFFLRHSVDAYLVRHCSVHCTSWLFTTNLAVIPLVLQNQNSHTTCLFNCRNGNLIWLLLSKVGYRESEPKVQENCWLGNLLLHSTMNCRSGYYIMRHLTSNLLPHNLAKFVCSTAQLYTIVIPSQVWHIVYLQ